MFLYGCETWSVTQAEGCILAAIENGLLIREFEFKM
jgi:hypothetical protein